MYCNGTLRDHNIFPMTMETVAHPKAIKST